MVEPVLRAPLLLFLVLIVGGIPRVHGQGSSGQVTSSSQQATAVLVDPVRIERAQRRLALASTSLKGEVSLGQLFRLVLVADDDGREPPGVDAHRAALFVAAFFVNQWPIEWLVPEARGWPRPTPRRVTLGGRHDHAQHFALSAAMAAAVGSPLAEAVAVFKELGDARGGSGFSFSDVLANRAGQRFGTLAANSAATAARLTLRLRDPLSDKDIMPAATGLADNLTEQQFTRRFGSVGAAAYNEVIAEIDARIGGLALYR